VALEPSGHRDRVGNLSKNRLAVLGTAYVGVLSVETVAEGLYRVSPLLRGVGPEVQGEAWATAMQSGIACTLLGFSRLSPTDVSTILFHAVAARDWSAVTHLSFGIVRSDNETWEALAQSADWFVLVGTGGATRPDTDVFSLFLIRLLQFKLAAAGRNDKHAASVIACLDEELPATIDGMPLRLARHFFLGQVLLCTELNLPIAQLVSMRLEYIRLADELKDVLAGVHDSEFDPALPGPEGAPDGSGVAGFALTPHLTDRRSLAALCEACEPVDARTVRRLLGFIGGKESTAQLIVDRIWLAEIKTASPDWPACREIFERAYALARRCSLPGLAQGAARAIARLTDKNLNDPVEALRLADEMAAEIGRSLARPRRTLNNRRCVSRSPGESSSFPPQARPGQRPRDHDPVTARQNAAQPIAIPFRQSGVMLRHLQSLLTLQYYPVWFRLCQA
jgi:hypothetical protein